MNAQLKTWQGVLAVLFAATIWGTTGVSASFAPDVSSLAIGAVAMGGGGLLLALRSARTIYRFHTQIIEFKVFLIIGALAVFVYPLAFYTSMRWAGITIGTVVNIGSAPIFSALLEFFFEKQRLSKRWIVGALIGIVGMLLLSFAKSHGNSGDLVSEGIALALFSGFLYALYSWAARQMMVRGIASKAAMGSIFGLGALLLLPVLLWTGAPLLANLTNFAVGAYMVIFPMFLGYWAFGYGLAHVSTSTAITITLFEPVVAAVLAVWIVGERLSFQGWMGIILILGCLVMITFPAKNKINSTS